MLARSLVLSSCCLALAAAAADYSGYQVLKVAIADRESADKFLDFVGENPDFEMWNEVRVGAAADVMVPPGKTDAASMAMAELGLTVTVMIEDVQGLIDRSRSRRADKGDGRQNEDYELTFDEYYDLEVFYEYFDYLEENFGDMFSTEVIGQSFEGRDLRLAKICSGGCGSKYVIWIDAGIHAREWIAPASAMYIVQQLVEFGDANTALTEAFDWYVLPSVNPDGYMFSRDEVDGDRLWRKTRSPNEDSICIGTDPNRNWDFHWGEGGSSDVPCNPSQTYMGDFPFSEQESLAVADYVEANNDLIVSYTALHSYGQYILLPWGFVDPETGPYEFYDDNEAVATVGVAAASALYDTQFQVGTIVSLVGVSTGGAVDWVPGVAGVKYAWAMELRDQGEFGFLLPEDQILPTAEEAFAYHSTVALQLADEFGFPEIEVGGGGGGAAGLGAAGMLMLSNLLLLRWI